MDKPLDIIPDFALRSPLTPGKRLLFCRENKGLSQKQLARASGLHHTLISHMENDSRPIHLAAAIRLAAPLGQDWRDLLSDPGEEASMSFEPPLGQKLAQLRRSRGWTQAQLSQLSGVGTQAISGIEAGAKRMGQRTRKALARAFKLSEKQLEGAVDSLNQLPYTLRRLRRLKAWSQEKMCFHTGFTKTLASRLESGLQAPSEAQMLLFCATYQVTPAVLVGGGVKSK